MGTAALVTAIFGAYDEPHPQAEQDADVEWFLFTDRDLSPPEPWQQVIEDPAFEDPCMAAKVAKMTPRLPHRHVIWIDGSVEVTSPSFAREAIGCIHDGMAVYAHPRRSCVYEEASASLGAESQGGRYDHLPIQDQMSSYLIEGHPAQWGLFACGVVAWDREASDRIGSAWLAECERWGHQDQLSLPPVLRRLNRTPGIFPHRQTARRHEQPFYFENPWVRIHPHR